MSREEPKTRQEFVANHFNELYQAEIPQWGESHVQARILYQCPTPCNFKTGSPHKFWDHCHDSSIHPTK